MKVLENRFARIALETGSDNVQGFAHYLAGHDELHDQALRQFAVKSLKAREQVSDWIVEKINAQ